MKKKLKQYPIYFSDGSIYYIYAKNDKEAFKIAQKEFGNSFVLEKNKNE